MTDGPDGSGQIPRRTTRVGDGGAPVSGALAIILAVVAVVAGFLILRSISDGGEQALDFDGSGSAADPANDGTSGSGTAPDESIATLPPTTTLPPIVTEGASVVVANANSVGGSASAMSRALETTYGFTMVDPVNSRDAIRSLDDSVIYFENANVVHTGDIFFNGFYPFVDMSSGGDPRGLIAAMDEILERIDDQTKIIPGHGPLASRKELEASRAMFSTVCDRISAAIAEGKTVDEVSAMKPTADFDAEWGDGFLKPDQFVRIVYSGLAG